MNVHWHRWGRWQPMQAEYAAGPLGRLLGLPTTWEEAIQARTCSKCGKITTRKFER